MKAVEQNSDDLNEIAEAYLTTPGDARDAWRVISTCLADGRDLPEWVKGYLLRVAGNVARLEAASSIAKLGNGVEWPSIAMALSHYPEPVEFQTKPHKAKYDSLTVFSIIARWRREARNAGQKLSLLVCFGRYINEILDGEAEEETVKTAYYRGKAIAADEVALLGAVAERGVSVPCMDQR